MDIATILGFAIAYGAYFASMLMNGDNPANLVNIPSLVMVVGGGFGVVILAHPLKLVMSIPALIMKTFKGVTADPKAEIDRFVELADQARREGLLSLEEQIGNIDNDFVKKGIMLVVDGVDPAVVRDIMEIDNELMSRRHKDGAAVIDMLGSVSPAMGMLGTVTGLVGVLGNLADASSLGPSVAVAFLTTLYGVILSNFLYAPLANKLKQNDRDEMVAREVIVEGILAIQAGENPRIVREKLESFLPPKLRGGDENAE